LALVLAALIAAAVAMAVDLHLRAFDSSRSGVEEARLARAVVQIISDDLRSAIRYDPLDIGSMTPEVPMTEELGSLLGGQADTDGVAGAVSSDTEGSLQSQSIPGLYGGSDWLQVDVAILPRLDQFDADTTSTEGSSLVDRSSDVKTVTYYVVESEDETGYAADGTPTGGLVRRVLDRAVSLWSSEIGQIDEDSDVTPLAPEVDAIAFRYGNGTEWVDAWDSQEEETLPLAVEVTLTIRPIRDPGGLVSSDQLAADEDETQWFTYTRIIHLLAAEAASADETFEETEETTETSESESTETGGETSR